MLTHYFELRAIPQIELTEVTIMNEFLKTTHKLLINYNGEVGISFPCYTRKQNKTLGGIIRYFGQKDSLNSLRNDLSNQSIIMDYGLLLEIKKVPERVGGYISLSRVRQKGQSALRRAEKRLSSQGKWSLEIKEKMIEKWGMTRLNYPHCHLISASTGQSFVMWIKQEYCHEHRLGKFNSYGMSTNATVPNF